MGALLFYQNFRARPVGYLVKKSAGGRTLGSSTMPYTGLMLLAFVVFHLFNFSLADKTNTTIYHVVAVAFSNPGTVLVYLAAVVVAGVHVHHGVWSAFQTLGANHPHYFPLIRKIGLGFSLIVGAGFGSIPIFLALLS
jgi:succinate dehydrogenase / fumarate reductase cytochrome b subunit